MKDAKLTPRITETAKALWLIYVGITVTCIFAYWLAGMKLFDAVGHAFSTVAIGGFSTHNDSLAYWNNPTVEIVAAVFMTIAGINFALHFTAWRRASAQPYFMDPEAESLCLAAVRVCHPGQFRPVLSPAPMTPCPPHFATAVSRLSRP